jgi:hypothetical protein
LIRFEVKLRNDLNETVNLDCIEFTFGVFSGKPVSAPANNERLIEARAVVFPNKKSPGDYQ